LNRPLRSVLPALAAGLLVVASPAARANARAETEEARVADILQSALVAHGREVNRCFERALADTLDVSGKLELEVDVGPGGRITKAKGGRDEVKSPVLLACLEESAVTWTLLGLDPGSTVIVPLSFEGQVNQFTIKVKDAPDHGPPVPAGKKRTGTSPPVPPFSVKLLVDEATMHARQAALTELTVAPANRIAMHKHPGAEVLYVRKGHARILGPSGVAPEKLDEGMAIFIPPDMPHAIENMGRQTPAVLLDVFVPMGPERVYRDPKDEAGRAALSVLGGKGKVRPLLETAKTGSKAVYLGILEAEPGAEVPRHSHAGAAEMLFVLAGAGEVTIGSEKIPFEADEALHIPQNQPHALKITGPDKTVMVQIYAPAGPEERFRAAQPAAPAKPASPPTPKTKKP
jgi:quercetin dioxygenase-like cupin family protein